MQDDNRFQVSKIVLEINKIYPTALKNKICNWKGTLRVDFTHEDKTINTVYKRQIK